MIKFILTSIVLLGFGIAFAGSPTVDEAAPNFKLKDISGKEVSLSDFKGKTVVLEWINFDCPFVRKHYNSGNMQSIQKEYTEKGIVWLSICSSAPGKEGNFDNDEIKSRISKSKANMSYYLLDENGDVGKLYAAKTTPHMFIIDKTGKLVYAGGIDNIKSANVDDIKTAKNYVRSALDEILSGKSVTDKTSAPYGCSVKY